MDPGQVGVNVVRPKKIPGSYAGPGRPEFEHHVLIRIIAVVDKDVDLTIDKFRNNPLLIMKIKTLMESNSATVENRAMVNCCPNASKKLPDGIQNDYTIAISKILRNRHPGNLKEKSH
jgi:hypothetical protein